MAGPQELSGLLSALDSGAASAAGRSWTPSSCKTCGRAGTPFSSGEASTSAADSFRNLAKWASLVRHSRARSARLLLRLSTSALMA